MHAAFVKKDSQHFNSMYMGFSGHADLLLCMKQYEPNNEVCTWYQPSFVVICGMAFPPPTEFTHLQTAIWQCLISKSSYRRSFDNRFSPPMQAAFTISEKSSSLRASYTMQQQQLKPDCLQSQFHRLMRG